MVYAIYFSNHKGYDGKVFNRHPVLALDLQQRLEYVDGWICWIEKQEGAA